jgi:hypothetical protein
MSVDLVANAPNFWDRASGSVQLESANLDHCAEVGNLVDNASGGTGTCADDAQVTDVACVAGAGTQLWQLQPDNTLIGGDGNCLNVPIWNGSVDNWFPADGIGLIMYPCTYPLTPNEVWHFNGTNLVAGWPGAPPPGASNPPNGVAGKCLTGGTNGAPLTLVTCRGADHQSWSMRF